MKQPRILVADDDADAVLMLSALLRDEGYQVRGVHHGAEVLDAVFNFAPDVVLLDIGMPKMSGYDVARTLRERYGSARPVLIAITGRAGQADRQQARAALSQASYYSHDDLRLHFGLGANAKADQIEVRWPSGQVDVLKDVAGRRVVTIREGESGSTR